VGTSRCPRRFAASRGRKSIPLIGLGLLTVPLPITTPHSSSFLRSFMYVPWTKSSLSTFSRLLRTKSFPITRINSYRRSSHSSHPAINMPDLSIELTAPNGRKYTQPVGLFINNEWVKSKKGEKITTINPTYHPSPHPAPPDPFSANTFSKVTSLRSPPSMPLQLKMLTLPSMLPELPSSLHPGATLPRPPGVICCSNLPPSSKPTPKPSPPSRLGIMVNLTPSP